MPELTPERLREIEARCEAAMAGPWSWMTWLGGQWALYAPGNAPHETGKPVPLNAPDDISFAAQARTDIPDLISALKQAREERDQLAAALAYARSDNRTLLCGMQ